MTPEGMRSSQPLYDRLAPTYEDHFRVVHRRMYDELAWDACVALLPSDGQDAPLVVDAGCGVGRWARRFLAHGCRVIGLEQSEGMIHELEAAPPGPGFSLIPGPMEDLSRPDLLAVAGMEDVPPAGADLVVAMGSLQYTRDPSSAITQLTSWLKPDGAIAVLVDSFIGLVLELIASGRVDEATERLATRRGVWRTAGMEADLHLLDRDALIRSCRAAGLVDIRTAGLLVGCTAMGREAFVHEATTDYEGVAARERGWSADPLLADIGKQLLVTARRAPSASPARSMRADRPRFG